MISETASIKKRLLALAAAGGIALFSAGNLVSAADCGCEPSCGACPQVKCCDCSCKCSPWPKHNCLSKAMKKVKGGLDKLIAKCTTSGCDDLCCDDACDAAMIEELMLPMPPQTLHHHSTEKAVPMHEAHGHDDYSDTDHHDPKQHDVLEVQPRAIDAAPLKNVPESKDSVQALPEPVDNVPPPVRMPKPETKTPEVKPQEKPGGSLFDTLSDPFKDDRGASLKRFGAVRPSSYEAPISRAPLSRSTHTSSRRTASRSR